MNKFHSNGVLNALGSRLRLGRKVALPLALALGLVLAACGGGESQNAGDSEALTIAVADFGNEQLDPALATGSEVSTMLLPLYDSLLEVAPDGKIGPGLAKSWAVGPDGVTWTFDLRDDAEFTGGYGPVTAEDVKFSIERAMNPKSPASVSGTLRDIVETITVVNDHTLQITTKGPQTLLPVELSPIEAGALIYSKKYLTEKGGDDFDAQSTAINEHPIGSGPYEFVSNERGRSLTYKAVENHWRVTPTVKTLKYVEIPDLATQAAMLKTGEADVIAIVPDQAKDLESSGMQIRTVEKAASVAVVFTGTYRQAAKEKATVDPRVRHALSLAIDRKALLDTLIAGYGQLPTMPYGTFSATTSMDEAEFAGWASDVQKTDLDEARRLLTEAGHPDGFGGFKFFSFARPGVEYAPQLTQAIAAQWEKIGVKSEIVSTDYANFRPHFMSPPDEDPYNAGDANVYMVSPWSDPFISLSIFFDRADKIAQLLDDPTITQLVDRAQATTDPAERQALIKQAYDRVNDSWIALPLFSADALYAVNPEKVGPWQTTIGWPGLGRMLETIS